jgi:hypothetical protein
LLVALAIALLAPLQAVAAMSAGFCAAHGHDGAMHPHDLSGHGHNNAPEQPHHDACSSCASCCSGALSAFAGISLIADGRVELPCVASAAAFTGNLPAGLERPPKQRLA